MVKLAETLGQAKTMGAVNSLGAAEQAKVPAPSSGTDTLDSLNLSLWQPKVQGTLAPS